MSNEWKPSLDRPPVFEHTPRPNWVIVALTVVMLFGVVATKDYQAPCVEVVDERD
jgi:hypothetical protein